jgi:cell division septation protein DedD
MWLLLPGREGIVSEPVAGGMAAVPAAAAAPQAALSPVPEASSGILQTGLFSREENTQAMAARLKSAGFTAIITRRRVNGTEYWAVGVSPGQNMNETILKLRDAGFESFPVYE